MFEKYMKDLTDQFYTAYFRILDKKKAVRPLEPFYYLYEEFGEGYMLTYEANPKYGSNVAASGTGTWKLWKPVNRKRSEKFKTVKQNGFAKQEDILAKILGAFTKEFAKDYTVSL